MENRTAETRLNLTYDQTSRFVLRLEYYEADDFAPSTVRFIEDLRTLEAAQRAYIEARDLSGLGGSRFLPGEVFDAAPEGDHVARISYNGRLWRPETWIAGSEPIAEAPRLPSANEKLVWMVGTRDSVLQDSYTQGPDNSPQILKLHMREGEILIGKGRDGALMEIYEKREDGIFPVEGGIDGLRKSDTLEI